MEETNEPETPVVENPESTPPSELSPVVAPSAAPDLKDIPDEDLPESPNRKEFTPPKKPRNKRWLKILVILIIIAALGVAAWMIFSKKSNSSTGTNSTNQTQSIQPTNSYTPVSVAYAFKDTDSNPYILYNRPVTGGDRNASDLKLTSGGYIGDSSVYGNNVAFTDGKSIYVSTDGGKTYNSIFKVSTSNEQNLVASLKLSGDGRRVIYSYFDGGKAKTTVTTVDLTGKDGKALFTSSGGVFINAFDNSNQKMVYRTGCLYCDGVPSLPILRDLKTNKETKLVTGVDTSLFVDMAVSNDLKTLVYVSSTHNSSDIGGPGTTSYAPITINTVDISTGKSTKVTTFGTKDEKNTNGTIKTREVHVGFVASSNTPFYTNDAQLFEIKSGTPSLLYQASTPILYIPFVGNDTVIAGSGTQTADYVLSNYNISTKKVTKIFSGDNNTVIFGVTTK